MPFAQDWIMYIVRYTYSTVSVWLCVLTPLCFLHWFHWILDLFSKLRFRDYLRSHNAAVLGGAAFLVFFESLCYRYWLCEASVQFVSVLRTTIDLASLFQLVLRTTIDLFAQACFS